MTTAEFLERWRHAGAAERANKDSFLVELCDVLGVERPLPKTNDPEKDRYVFEKDVVRSREDGTSIGRIDLFRAGCFVLEAKQVGAAKRGTPAWEQAMNDALGQALGYARSLPQPPPFVVVCDIGHCFDLHASFDGSGAYRPFPDGFKNRLFFKDLESHLDTLRKLWLAPLDLDPSRQQSKITREIAAQIAFLARELEAPEGGGQDPRRVAEFLMRCLFTMFAEDVGLLPGKLFSKYLAENWLPNPPSFPGGVGALWRDMNEGRETVAGKLLRFNGGLFADSQALALTKKQLELLQEAAKSNWAEVDPSIFGTLLERALSPEERHRLGAHYTPRAYVERLVKPTIEEPLRADWDLVRAEVRQLVEGEKIEAAQQRVLDFHRRLCSLRVLDPACGTGNFLYVTLDLFKRLESEVLAALAGLGYTQLGLEMEKYRVTPEQFRGIEVKPWAKEIAELVLWIGYLQWQVRQTGGATTIPEPVLRDYDNIECRDAVLAWDGDPELARDDHGVPITRWDGTTMKKSAVTGEPVPDSSATIPVYTYKNPRPAEWPKADFIIGNPPYIGNKRMRIALGDGYVEALRGANADVPETADYVMYWWSHAAELVRRGAARQSGLITTNSISQSFSRKVVERFVNAQGSLAIVFAVPDHPWVDSADGAAVRVAMTVVGRGNAPGVLGRSVEEAPDLFGAVRSVIEVSRGHIQPSLVIGQPVHTLHSLMSNRGLAFRGVTLVGDGFIVDAGAFAGSEVVRSLIGARGILDGGRGRMVIDFFGFREEEARERFPREYQRIYDSVRPIRLEQKRALYSQLWWVFAEPRPGLRAASNGLAALVCTVETAKHRFFSIVPADALPEQTVVAICLSQSCHTGVLSSRLHTVWSAATGATLEDRPRYSIGPCFESFPFPVCAFDVEERIRSLGEQLDAHRKRQQAAHPGLTITGMYNVLEKLRSGEELSAKERVIHEQGLVSVLKQIHDELDAAVFEAYGWPVTLTDEEILERLVALNHERAEEEKRGLVRWLRPEFQNPQGAGSAAQAELPGTAPKSGKAAKGAKAAKPEKVEKRAWPKELPQQVAAVRDLLGETGNLDLATAKSAFKGAKDDALSASLDSLAALGLAVAVGEGGKRSWSAVR
ncbi:MAG: DNA methyltransferase [Thermoanaerobaculia bacterium]